MHNKNKNNLHLKIFSWKTNQFASTCWFCLIFKQGKLQRRHRDGKAGRQEVLFCPLISEELDCFYVAEYIFLLIF